MNKLSNSHICSACCSPVGLESNISHVKRIEIDSLQSFEVSYRSLECDVCGFSEIIDRSFDASYKMNREKSDKETMKSLVEYITKDLGNSFFERSYSLPPRTLNRWKTQSFSSAGMALLKLTKIFPWLVKVAEHGYNEDYAKTEFCNQFVKLLLIEHKRSTSNWMSYRSEYSTGTQTAVVSVLLSDKKLIRSDA